ncbi:reverse transcriptase domain-containing protein [Tanacetum coccineum]
MEKLILALVHAARRLRRYFQAHMITVMTNSPIKQTLMKPKKSERVAKWEIELGEHDIVFQERGDKTLKDFLIEAPLEDNEKKAEEKADTRSTKMKLSYEWKLFTDGAVSSDGSGAGLMLIDPRGKEYNYFLHFRFETTNNKAEYEKGKLLAGTYAAKQPTIREYLQKTKEALKGFDSYTIEHIRTNQNKKADALSKLASMTFKHLTKEMVVEILPKQSIEEKEILQVETKEGESWMTPIHEYLVSGLLPEDPKESRKIRVKAPQYKLIRGNLYRRSFFTPWLRVTLPRNSQKETPFSLTYGSEAIIPIPKNDVAKYDRERIKEVYMRRGNKEIASIEEAYYQSKLCRHHSERSSHSIYKIGDFILLSQSNTGGT